ncbi:MAG: AAA family ATPase, partial [Myxococcota bacterium]
MDVWPDPERSAQAMSRLRRALDEAIAGQHEAKLGLLLAWLAREHALLVGPPGCGKSRLAVALMRAAGGESRAVGLHRDSTSEELLGPMQIKWVRTPGGRGLRLRRRTLPGELRPAELLLLDDLGRAPRETFHALLRVLDARDRPGPPRQLTTAIATLHPLGLVSHADPLEPAQLDRFAVQLRLRGLIADQCWGDARR